ncbi:MAG: glycoside hydrolase [Acidobacteriia bacterium]|nr:glycoside hydrolase [Terriglobia bacterium]
MKFELIGEGFICQGKPGGKRAAAGGSRAVALSNGELLCSFGRNSGLGVNDFAMGIARSKDGGLTWEEQGPIWPHLEDTYSIIGSISHSPADKLFLYGISIPIDQEGELFWSNESQGIKENKLFWATSTDQGRRWSEPQLLSLPIKGSAEAPGALCVSRQGHWLACFAPYNTFDPKVIVDRQQIVAIISEDEGKTWEHTAMLRFPEEHSGGAEAWIIELDDGRVLGTCWHVDHQEKQEYPNAFSISHDGGKSWGPTHSTGIMGQSTALAALPGGRALFIYNQRKHGEVGIWLAVVNPTDSNFGVESNEIVWKAQTATQSSSSGGHSEWTDFAFGEPSVTLLQDGTLLVTFWCAQPSGKGVQYVKLAMKN